MSEIVLKFQKWNENIKDFFNFDGIETQPTHLKEFIQNSENAPQDFIDFLDIYSQCRTPRRHVTQELVECVYSYFPEQMNEIQQKIKNTHFLRFIVFPEEFPIDESKEQKEMFLLLQRDDIDEFISFLSKNPTIDI